MRIVLSTGGTGGHIFPALKLSEELKIRGYEIILITDQRGEKYQNKEKFDHTHIIHLHKSSGFMGKLKQILDILTQSYKIKKLYKTLKPELVIGFGGYSSAPALIAAKLSGIPFVIHEQNAVLGRVNKLMSFFAKKVALGFENTLGVPKDVSTLFVGNPVRDEFLQIQRDKKETPPHRLFIFAGSQGAALFSHIIPSALEKLPQDIKNNLKIIMQSREELIKKTQDNLLKSGVSDITVKPFFLNMGEQLASADLVIARGGAMTVTELSTVGCPSIFVPLEIAMDNHQYYNIKNIHDAGAAWMILEKDFNSDHLANNLKRLLSNRNLLEECSELIKSFSTPNSTILFADEIDRLTQKTHQLPPHSLDQFHA